MVVPVYFSLCSFLSFNFVFLGIFTRKLFFLQETSVGLWFLIWQAPFCLVIGRLNIFKVKIFIISYNLLGHSPSWLEEVVHLFVLFFFSYYYESFLVEYVGYDVVPKAFLVHSMSVFLELRFSFLFLNICYQILQW